MTELQEPPRGQAWDTRALTQAHVDLTLIEAGLARAGLLSPQVEARIGELQSVLEAELEDANWANHCR